MKTFCAFSNENLITRGAAPEGKVLGIECIGPSDASRGSGRGEEWQRVVWW